MTTEEELAHLQEEKNRLLVQLAQREEHIQHLEAVVEQQNTALKQLQEQLSGLSQQVKTLQERMGKDSHNSHSHGQRGRSKQSDARYLLDLLRKQQKAVFYFLEALLVDFENNLAERDLRMMKVQQKISGGFRSLEGAQAFARIWGYLSTLRKQGLPVLSALQATLAGHPVLPSLKPT